jgi:predicted transcriptional regulator
MPDDDRFSVIAADLLRSARTDAGLSLRETARRAATSYSTLHDYETGRKTPSVTVFLRLIEACGYALDFNLTPRIRWQDGIYRGDELEQVLKLAGQFPSKAPRYMDYPRFGAPDAGSH